MVSHTGAKSTKASNLKMKTNTKVNKTKGKKFNWKKKGQRKKVFNRRGAIFLGNLPHGFYEMAIRKYFAQYGVITRSRVARSDKTANPMGWAYVEFLDEAVAKIVCQTMDGYMLFDNILKCRLIRHEDLNYKMFYKANLKPEECNATKNKLSNQFHLEKRKSASYRKKKSRQVATALRFTRQALGIQDAAAAAAATTATDKEEAESPSQSTEAETTTLATPQATVGGRTPKKKKKNRGEFATPLTGGKEIQSLEEISASLSHSPEEATTGKTPLKRKGTPASERKRKSPKQDKALHLPEGQSKGKSPKLQPTQSPKEQKLTTKSPKEQKLTTKSPKEQKLTTKSPKEQKLATKSPKEQKLTTKFPKEQKLTTKSPKEQKLTTKSPKEQKLTKSPKEQKLTTKSPKEQKLTTKSPRQRKSRMSPKERKSPESPQLQKMTISPKVPKIKLTPKSLKSPKVPKISPKETKPPKSPKAGKITPKKSPKVGKITPKETKPPKSPKARKITPKKSPKQHERIPRQLRIEIDEVDSEIIVKTPPNVVKSIRKGKEEVIRDPEESTVLRAPGSSGRRSRRKSAPMARGEGGGGSPQRLSFLTDVDSSPSTPAGKKRKRSQSARRERRAGAKEGSAPGKDSTKVRPAVTASPKTATPAKSKTGGKKQTAAGFSVTPLSSRKRRSLHAPKSL